ncbi:MAG: cyclase family protein [Acidobacteria bacterium]|nr:cyclase family protein [Acidobacteriota bacterium]
MKRKQLKISLAVVLLLTLGVMAAIGAQTKTRSQSAKTGATTTAVADDRFAAAEFLQKCAMCHKADGKGGNGVPNFTDPAFHKLRSEARLLRSITNGRGGMPSFKQTLKPTQMKQLIHYIRGFPARAAQPEKPAAALDAKPAAANGEGLLERALKGQAQIIDLTHIINDKTPTFGGERDAFRYEKLSDIKKDGYASGAFRMPEHFGTHIDAPGHFIVWKETIERVKVKRLIAPAVVLDIRKQVEVNADYQLSAADIAAFEKGGAIPEGAAVLLLTGWDKRYAEAEKYRNADANGVLHFPGFSEEAIQYLLRNPKIVALGIDTLSIDYGPSKNFQGHRIALGSGLYHLENLTNLDKLPARGAVIFVGALPIEGGSGSPARVIAIAP